MAENSIIANGISAGAGCLIGWTWAKETFISNFNECFELIKNNRESDFIEKYGLISKDTFVNVKGYLNNQNINSNTLETNSINTIFTNAKSTPKLKMELQKAIFQNTNLFVSNLDELKNFLKNNNVTTIINLNRADLLDSLIKNDECPPKIFNFLKQNISPKFPTATSLTDYINKLNTYFKELDVPIVQRLTKIFENNINSEIESVLNFFLTKNNLVGPRLKLEHLDKLLSNQTDVFKSFILKNESKIVEFFSDLKLLNRHIIDKINTDLNIITSNEKFQNDDLTKYLTNLLNFITDIDKLFGKLSSQNNKLELSSLKNINSQFSMMYGKKLVKKILKMDQNIDFDNACNQIEAYLQKKQQEHHDQVEALKQNDEIFLLSSLNTYLANKNINPQVFTKYTLKSINIAENRNSIVKKIYEQLFVGAEVVNLEIDYSEERMTSLEFLKFCYYCISKIKLNTFIIN